MQELFSFWYLSSDLIYFVLSIFYNALSFLFLNIYYYSFFFYKFIIMTDVNLELISESTNGALFLTFS